MHLQFLLPFQLIAEGSEDKKEREYASNILPLRSQGNFLLCSIVLGNTICNTLVTLLINDMCESINDYFVYVRQIRGLFVFRISIMKHSQSIL